MPTRPSAGPLERGRGQPLAADAILDRAESRARRVDRHGEQVTEAKAAVTEAERTVAGTVLKAPMAGTVTAINGSIGGSSAGSSASTGADGGGGSTGFIDLANLASMQVSASFAEADATKLKLGQAAAITWAALAGATAQGKVASIAPTATTSTRQSSTVVVSTTICRGMIGRRHGRGEGGAEARVCSGDGAAVRAMGNGMLSPGHNGTTSAQGAGGWRETHCRDQVRPRRRRAGDARHRRRRATGNFRAAVFSRRRPGGGPVAARRRRTRGSAVARRQGAKR